MAFPTTKIVYSLRVHTQLQKAGFEAIVTMPNPKKPKLNCWVYEETEQFNETLKRIIGGIRNE